MSETVVQARSIARFFCHRCNVEFEDVLRPEFVCPYCAGGFIEQLEGTPAPVSGLIEQLEGIPAPNDLIDQLPRIRVPEDFTDADMSSVNESDQDSQSSTSHPFLNELAFLMSGGQVRRGRPESLLEQLVLTIGGGAAAASGAVTAGAPFVFVSAPGDYVFGGEGLDAVVTQMLGQLEHAGPPPLSRDQIAAIPTEPLSAEQRAAHPACSVCWDDFVQDEMVSRLECEHIFHPGCIEPWLRLHATCPICRHSLQNEESPPPSSAASTQAAPSTTASTTTTYPATSTTTVEGILTQTFPSRTGDTPWPWERTAHLNMSGELPRVVVRRLPLRLISGHQTQTWDSPENMSGSGSSNSSVTTGGVWAPPSRSTTNSSGSTSSTSLNSDRDRQYNMDIDYD